MNIMYLCDDNYVYIAAVSIISLLENNQEADYIHIYLVSEGISNSNKEKLFRTVEKYGRKLIILEKPNLKLLIGCRVETHWWIENVFSRVFLKEVFKDFPEIERVIYIDCDTLVVGCLKDLWEIDLENNVAAGVLEAMGNMHKKAIGLKKHDPYFNAGVFVIDMNKWRECNYDKKASSFIKNMNGKLEYADESVLNGILAKKMKIIPLKYNVTSLSIYFDIDEITKYRKPFFHYNENERRESLDDARIIHFTSTYTDVRPWTRGSKHPYANEWIKIKNESLWNNYMLENDKRGIKKKICSSLVLLLPRNIRLFITGIMHAYVKPIRYVFTRLYYVKRQ